MFWNHIFCPPFVEDYTKPRNLLLDLEIGLWMRIKIPNESIELINKGYYVSNAREFLVFPILTSPSLRSCYRLSKVSRCANVKCVKRWILMANSFQGTEKKTCYNTVSVPNQLIRNVCKILYKNYVTWWSLAAIRSRFELVPVVVWFHYCTPSL